MNLRSHLTTQTLQQSGMEKLPEGAIRNIHGEHGEDDVIIVNQLVDLADRGVNYICVVCDDTDVFILMLHSTVERI